jgi:hypothetical protein
MHEELYEKSFGIVEHYHGRYSEFITIRLGKYNICWERFYSDHKAWGRTYNEGNFKIHGWRFRGIKG